MILEVKAIMIMRERTGGTKRQKHEKKQEKAGRAEASRPVPLLVLCNGRLEPMGCNCTQSIF